MSPDLPEKLLGISIDDPSDRPSRENTDEEEEVERFTLVAIGERRLAIAVDDVKTITDPPAELTRVPRAPESIDGVTDLRGEITAVIDPRVLFPVRESPPPSQRLVVFDRPTDQQQAAIRVDEVLGVETVPVRNVRDVDEVAADVADDIGRHPLVSTVVQQERRSTADAGSAIDLSGDPDASDRRESERGSDRRSRPAIGGASGDADDPFAGETFELEDDSDESVTEQTDADETEEVVVETTALLDVDGLLAAAGRSD